MESETSLPPRRTSTTAASSSPTASRSAAFSVFFAATIGYSLYYVCRLSLSVIKSPLVNEGVVTEFQLGLIGSTMFYAYGVGKLINSFLADRLNIRTLASIGLFLSAVINLMLGFHAGFYAFFVLWLLNGWFQSMGPGAFVVGITRWFSAKERGTYYGLWSASHNIGEGLTFVFTALVVGSFGWRYGWWVSALMGFLGVGVIWFFFKDKPPGPEDDAAMTVSKKVDKNQAQWNLLKEPAVWLIALASLFMYVSRYSINSWGIFFLENAKGYGIEQASLIISAGAICGVVGTVASGWLSDRLFDGERGIPAILAGALNALSIVCFLVVPAGWMFVDMAAMVVFGTTIGALICYLGGLMAVDIAGRDAAGAALGIVGIASYAGAGTQDIISGFLIGANKEIVEGGNVYNFFPMGVFWTFSAILSVLMTVLAWHQKKKRAARIS